MAAWLGVMRTALHLRTAAPRKTRNGASGWEAPLDTNANCYSKDCPISTLQNSDTGNVLMSLL